MHVWELGDGIQTVARFGAWVELESVLKNILSSETNAKVFTLGSTDKEHFVQFGFSPANCFLEFHPHVGTSKSYVANEVGPKSEDAFWFDYAGTPTEIPSAMCVSNETLLRALRQYVETGSRPTCVSWSEA